jgi:hypothetical protein
MRPSLFNSATSALDKTHYLPKEIEFRSGGKNALELTPLMLILYSLMLLLACMMVIVGLKDLLNTHQSLLNHLL